ncbi:hypothetical protein ANTPLA_LOCUS10807 [Anthophora plagiata]
MDDLENTCILTFLLMGQFTSLFMFNYNGQNLINHSNEVYQTACNSEWYRTPLFIQKSLFLILLKTTKQLVFRPVFVFNPSIEGFSMLVKTSVSYFMVVYSMQ